MEGPTRARLGGPAIAVGSGISNYLGAALAVMLFETYPPVSVAWMRMVGAAIILGVVFRPHPRDFFGQVGRAAAIYGVVTVAMNMFFYEAISALPMGTAVAIEFAGPIAVAAWGSRSVRDAVAVVFAAAGVIVISGYSWSTSMLGIAFALLAGIMWGSYIVYIVVGARISRGQARRAEVGDAVGGEAASKDSQPSIGAVMAIGFAWASVVGFPIAAWQWGTAPDSDTNLLVTAVLTLGLGLLSSVIPYSLDQVVLRMSGPGYFALLQAILPVVAALIGAFALSQWLSVWEIVGIALVVLAVVLRRP